MAELVIDSTLKEYSMPLPLPMNLEPSISHVPSLWPYELYVKVWSLLMITSYVRYVWESLNFQVPTIRLSVSVGDWVVTVFISKLLVFSLDLHLIAVD